MSKKRKSSLRNPVARELREKGPREQTIRNKRNKLREEEARQQIAEYYAFLPDELTDDQ